MHLVRVIPCLLLKGSGLVKTVGFDDPTYVGDPRNAVKIFNDKEVDELLLLDIGATSEGRSPRLELIEEIVSEAFMPVAYGGGIRSVDDAREVLALGVEKVVIGTAAVENEGVVRGTAAMFGSQSVLVCIDVKKKRFGGCEVFVRAGRKATGLEPVEFAKRMADLGAGEIIVNSVDRDGTMQGYDIALTKSVARAVEVPVVACGGAGSLDDIARVVKEGAASAAAAGSMFVFHGRHRAVLISYPEQGDLRSAFG
ncbi:MAG: imidazole glycerol phosphate synthase subunit HisF [Deltaproteobacteria bacterium]|nr:imidazole glycerol phosphate synthase subunit HisF [Deltaproteobacteria bacterium]